MNLKFTSLNPKSTQSKPNLLTLFPLNGVLEAEHKVRTLLKIVYKSPKKFQEKAFKRKEARSQKHAKQGVYATAVAPATIGCHAWPTTYLLALAKQPASF